MEFLEKMLLSFGIKKALESIDDPKSNHKKCNFSGVATYIGLRQTFYSINDFPDYLLDELFRREPDHIDGETGPDCREYLNLKVSQYTYRDRTIYGETWFTLSVNNRFLCNAILDGLFDDDLRSYNLIDFSTKPFNAFGNPNSKSIKIGDYTLYFDHPFFYNLTLMLLKRADEQFNSSPPISSRAINLPNVVVSNSLLKKYNITTSIDSNEGVQLKGASYAVLTDFNSENNYEKDSGTITLRVVDGNKTTSDNYTPCSIRDLLSNKDCVRNGSLWISIAPSPIRSSTYLLGTQFMFLETAEDVIIRGDPNTCELYVCRTLDGWGGIKFKLQNSKDYYSAAAWLIPAVSMYCYGLKGWDYKETIKKYWLDYFCETPTPKLKKETTDILCDDEKIDEFHNIKRYYFDSDESYEKAIAEKKEKLRLSEQKLEELINRIQAGEVWDEINFALAPENVCVNFLFPNGKAGDIDMWLAKNIGEVKEIEPTKFSVNVPTSQREILSLFAFIYCVKWDDKNPRTELQQFMYDCNLFHRLRQECDDFMKEGAYRQNHPLRNTGRSLANNYIDLIRSKRKTIYDIIVASGQASGKWVSEQKVYMIIKSHYDDAIFQYKAKWLENQSIDIFIPSQNLAIEYQGPQHFVAIDFFGGEDGLSETKKRDEKKRKKCLENGITLIELRFDEPITAEYIINLIKSKTI